MKKLVFALAIGLLASGAALAQGWGGPGMPPGGWGPPPDSVTVSGTLQLVNGHIAVVNEEDTFFVLRLGRFVGFIDGMKTGAAVTIEGFAFGNFLQPVSLTVGGATHDLGSPGPDIGWGGGWGAPGMMIPGGGWPPPGMMVPGGGWGPPSGGWGGPGMIGPGWGW